MKHVGIVALGIFLLAGVVAISTRAVGCVTDAAAPAPRSRLNRAEWFLRAQISGAGSAADAIDAVCDDDQVPAGSGSGSGVEIDYATCLVVAGSGHLAVGIEWCEAHVDRAPTCRVIVDFKRGASSPPPAPSAPSAPPPAAPLGAPGSAAAAVPLDLRHP